MFSFFNISNANYEKVFFDYEIMDINNKNLKLSKYKNKIVLLVNVASNCGFTKQYSELQELFDKYSDKGLVVLALTTAVLGIIYVNATVILQ